jgi:hypothetical protein
MDKWNNNSPVSTTYTVKIAQKSTKTSVTAIFGFRHDWLMAVASVA